MSKSGTQTEERILSFEAALNLVFAQCEQLRSRPRGREDVPLLESLGRTLAEDILADRDFPPFPRATRDGYAVCSQDLGIQPVQLSFMGEIRAGGDFPPGFAGVKRGQALSIMTGAPVPEGADSVVMVEYTRREADRVHVLRPVHIGENIVPRGAEGRAGTCLAPQGSVISHRQIALAAAVGMSNVRVYARPKIAILATGDEVVPLDHKPKQNQIRNSNSFSVAAQVISAGGEPVQLPIAPDEPTRLRDLIRQGLHHDLLLMSGGVSAGEYDLVEDALSDFSAEFIFTGVQIQPGKPLVFGRAHAQQSKERWTYFFGLPGNPISTMVTFELFARMMVRSLSGAAAAAPRGTKARLLSSVKVKSGLTRFLPACLSGEWNEAQVEAVRWQGSGDLAAFARADCLLVIPPDREEFQAGEMMTMLLL
jgi:molybdopterin molybdotransferase